MRKKFVILVGMLSLAILGGCAMADTASAEADIQYKVEGSTLTISGTGAMDAKVVSAHPEYPWDDRRM